MYLVPTQTVTGAPRFILELNGIKYMIAECNTIQVAHSKTEYVELPEAIADLDVVINTATAMLQDLDHIKIYNRAERQVLSTSRYDLVAICVQSNGVPFTVSPDNGLTLYRHTDAGQVLYDLV